MATVETDFYPIFMQGQVLKSKDLNDIPAYLERQDNLTRSQLIGTGILYGMEVRWLDEEKLLSVGRGVGISSSGHLLYLPEDCKFSRYDRVSLPGYYFPPGGTSSFEALKLNETGAERLDQLLPDFPGCEEPTCKKCLLALREKMDDGTLVSCFNGLETSTKKIRFQTNFYLVDKTLLDQLAPLPDPAAEQPVSFSAIPLPYLRRLAFDSGRLDIAALDRSNFKQLYLAACGHGIEQLSNAFQHLVAAHAQLLGPNLDFGDVKANLEATLAVCGEASGFQLPYFYEFLEDLSKAFRELVGIGRLTLPAAPQQVSEDLFPNHLLLGGFGELQSRCRTPKYCHSHCGQNDGPLQKARFLYHRLHKLLHGHAFGSLPQEPVRITPSRDYGHRLGERAIPFYYNPDTVRPAWSYEHSVKGRTQEIHSFFRGDIPPYDEPLLYELEPWGFYRVEGHAMMPVEDAIARIEEQRERLNIAFDIMAVPLDRATRQLALPDLAAHFGQLREEWLQAIQNDDRLSALRDFLESALELDQIDLQLLENMVLNGPEANSCRYRVVAHLRHRWDEQQPPVFGEYAQQHSGLEHLGGVQPGGTLVLVYDDSEGNTENRTPVVLADFCLPYQCCPKPAPATEIFGCFPARPVCSSDQPSEIFTWPPGGRVIVSANGELAPEAAIVSPATHKWQFVPSGLPAGAFDAEGVATADIRFLHERKAVPVQTVRVGRAAAAHFKVSAFAVPLSAEQQIGYQVTVEDLKPTNASLYRWRLEWLKEQGGQAIEVTAFPDAHTAELPFSEPFLLEQSPTWVRVVLEVGTAGGCLSQFEEMVEIVQFDPRSENAGSPKGNNKSGKGGNRKTGKSEKEPESGDTNSDEPPAGGTPVSDTARSLDAQDVFERRLSQYKAAYYALSVADEASNSVPTIASLFFLLPPKKGNTTLRYQEMVGRLLEAIHSLSPHGQATRRKLIELLTLSYWDKLLMISNNNSAYIAEVMSSRALLEQNGISTNDLVERWCGEELLGEPLSPQSRKQSNTYR